MATNVIHETFKVIKDHDSYQVSNCGNIFSTKRGRLLKPFKDKKGYLNVDLDKKSFKVHHLVWDNFGDRQRDGLRLQIDHIDNVKTNNHIDNLRLVTNRENCVKRSLLNKTSGLPLGVSKFRDKFIAQMRIGKKHIHLGVFDNIREASEMYKHSVSCLDG